MAAKPRLLIVEDNLDHQELFSDVLASEYDLSFTTTPEECLTRLQRRNIDLVILDYYLQEEFTGLELLKTIALIYPRLPVIIVTAYGDEEIAVQAIKSGASDYVKKTLDQNYIRKLSSDIREILGAAVVLPRDANPSLLDFFMQHKREFREQWKKKIAALTKKFDPGFVLTLPDEEYEKLFNSFLADLENESAALSLEVLKKMIWSAAFKAGSLLQAELLNASIKETARDLFLKHYPATPDLRVHFMRRIGTLIDQNDLELCREYEKIVSESTKNMLRLERVSTKLLLTRTLQHEIRQPLTYIFNSIELLLTGECQESPRAMYTTILEQVKKIENLLFELEKDSETPLKDYSDKLPIFDIAPEEEKRRG